MATNRASSLLTMVAAQVVVDAPIVRVQSIASPLLAVLAATVARLIVVATTGPASAA